MKTLLVILISIGVLIGYFESYRPASERQLLRVEIPQEKLGRTFSPTEIECLAKVIYRESRGESTIGQVAVGAVVLNRTKDSRFKHTSICAIVSAPKQFAYRLIGKPEAKAYATAERIANYVACNYHLLEGLHEYKYFNSNKHRAGGTRIGGHSFYQ